ncbi:MAG: PEGA domain-containing protein [Deltaproteobacteria bacterium]|nr:PEGA domain-containing protein [Deltaproteobacteria bacterium]
MNTFSRLCGLCLVLGVAPPVYAEAPAAGDVCTLTKAAKASPKVKAPPKIKLKAKQKVSVVSIDGGWVQLGVGKKTAFLKAKALDKICKITKRAADTPAALPAEAAALPPGPATDDEKPIGFGKALAAQIEPEPTPKPDVAPVPAETGSAPAPALTPVPGAAAPTGASSGFGETTKLKVAVMDLAATDSLPKDLVTSLSSLVAETLDATGAFKAISSQDIVKLLSYAASQQQMGCDDMTCIAEIGGALGADYLVTGSLTQTGSQIAVQLQLADIKASRVDNRVSRAYEGGHQGLYDELKAATQILVRDILAKKSGMLAVTVNEEGASVKVDGSIIGVSPLPAFSVAGGVHNLMVEKEGFVTYRADVTIEESQTLAHDAHLVPSEDFVKSYESHAGFVRTMSWICITAGVVGLGGGGALYYLGSKEAQDLNKQVDAYNADVRRRTTTRDQLDKKERRVAMMDMGALSGAGIGVVGLITGFVLRAVGDDPDRYKMTSRLTVGARAPDPEPPTLRLVIAPTAKGVVVAGAF